MLKQRTFALIGSQIRHRTVSTDDLDAVENGDYVPTESR